MARSMIMAAFLQAQNCSNYAASWRHQQSSPGFLTAEYYQDIARTLEQGKFHLAFFDDRLAMPDRYGDDHALAVTGGVRVVKLDPVPLMTAMGLATRHLGIGGTYSTTYHEPFHVARVFSTLDHMVGGRAAWNVVTSFNDSEAKNFGLDRHLEHDLRYDRADEFMEAVLGHWDSWSDDAIEFDRESHRFADPAKVRRLAHAGSWFKTRGPFTVPRTPQGRPVIIQAGQSGRGRAFAARWAELVFIIQPTVAASRETYNGIKQAVTEAGRDPASVRVLPAVYCGLGETREIARERFAYAESLADEADKLTLLSEVMNVDFASLPMDEPLPEWVMTARGRSVDGTMPTLREFLAASNRGTVRELPCLVGTAKDVADELEAWFTAPACDGFVVAATHVPGAYAEFVRSVVPELQRRGLFHREYTGATLRDNLGFPRAQQDDWKL